LSPVAPHLLLVDRLCASRGRGPHTRRTDTAKLRILAYLSGRGQWGQMLLPPGADNASYAWLGSANVAASVYFYKEQERPLRCRPIVLPRPMAGL